MAPAESELDSSENKLSLQVKALLWKKGREGLEIARNEILQENIQSKPLQEAMRYFMSSWQDVVHPALLALTCEAVGGNPQSTTSIGAALILLAGGADIHDDIIDDSGLKYDKETVLGKFGKDIAVLAGDAFIVKGFYALHEACEVLPKNQRKIVFELVKEAFFGISSAEAKESSLRTANSIEPEEYLDMIKTKAAVSEATARIGAILGGGSPIEIEALASFGKAFGLLMMLKDEFIDVFELDEMKNRAKKEWLPLPILYALRNPEKAEELKRLLKGNTITQKKLERTIDLVFDSSETGELKEAMKTMIAEQNQKLQFIKLNHNELRLMLESAVEGL